MLKRIREEKTEDGFTLIELMVVVLIISILIAIAIPTFLGAREGAEDRSAQSNVRNALTAAKVYYADEGRWLDAANADADTTAEVRALVNAAEPSLAMQDALVTEASGANGITAIFDTQDATFVAYSESGTCFYMLEIATGPTAGTYFDDQASAGDPAACPAAAADPAVGNLGAWEQGGW